MTTAIRSAASALQWSRAHPTIPYSFIGNDGQVKVVDDLECMRSVLADFKAIPTTMDYGTATKGWDNTIAKHYDRRPLRGAPVYFINRGAGKSGHVAEGTGEGEQVWSTPVWLGGGTPYQEKFLTTITELEEICGNAYTGWGSDIDGQEIDFTSAAGEHGNPFPNSLRSINVSYELIPGACQPGTDILLPGQHNVMVCTAGLDKNGQLIEDILAGEDWGIMVTAHYNAGPISVDGNAQYRGLVKSQLARVVYPFAGGSTPVIDYTKLAKALVAEGVLTKTDIPTIADATAVEFGDRLDGTNDGK